VNQAITTIAQYVRSILAAKEDGVSVQEKMMLSLMGLTMGTTLASSFMLAPSAVLEAVPQVAEYLRVVLPEE
jgi:hypothetical protein